MEFKLARVDWDELDGREARRRPARDEEDEIKEEEEEEEEEGAERVSVRSDTDDDDYVLTDSYNTR